VTLEEAKAILAALVREHVEFVVIGSMAMAAQGLPRATHDLDMFVSPKIENLEALKRALRDLFNDPNIDQIDPGGLLVQVANPKMLYLMKKDTVRPQDRADAARIREAFDLRDE